jgi:hypothetical protein
MSLTQGSRLANHSKNSLARSQSRSGNPPPIVLNVIYKNVAVSRGAIRISTWTLAIVARQLWLDGDSFKIAPLSP